MKKLLISLVCFIAAGNIVAGQELGTELLNAELTVQVDKIGIKVSPSLYGIFFEEINHAGDGGIYPELIRNRSFEFKTEPEFWKVTDLSGKGGKISVEKNDAGSQYNSQMLQVRVFEIADGFSVVNDGYWGVPVAKDAEYKLVVKSKAGEDFSGLLDFVIQSSDGKTKHASAALKMTKDWQTHEINLRAKTDDPKAQLAIVPSSKGTFWIDYVSLKPVKTYKNHGLRIDLMEKLAAIKPAFIRFPGGCWVEGKTMLEASRWKRTIGQEMERWTQPNLWGYHSTNGLGYHEYLQMCEDLEADAMFVINCGMSHKENVPMDKMDEYVQDALDAIEYANGTADSTWGKIRAANGHPQPFSLKYIQIGNENGGTVYWERYDYFHKKIREKYPDIQIVACKWEGKITNTRPIEIYDEHYYNNPSFFIKNANRYDNYERSGKKIYVGEYAVTSGSGKGNLNAAIGEAAFMTGMEKNSDVVILSSYAPLFVNVKDRKWNPDLIVFDCTRSYGIPSYHVQQLFSTNRSDVIVPTSISLNKNEQKLPATEQKLPAAEQKLPATEPIQLYVVSGLTEKRDELIMKIVNTSPKPYETKITLEGITKINTQAKKFTLTSQTGNDENTLDSPQKISPKESTFPLTSQTFNQTLPPNSLTILRVKIK